MQTKGRVPAKMSMRKALMWKLFSFCLVGGTEENPRAVMEDKPPRANFGFSPMLVRNIPSLLIFSGDRILLEKLA